MIPRYGRPPKNGQNYVLRQGAYAILPRGGHILLTHQSSPDPEFQLPGGGIDPSEGTCAALAREVLEETGWRIARPRRFGVFRRFTFMPDYGIWAEKICHIYVAHPVMKVTDRLEAGHSEIWVSGSVAPALLANSGDRSVLADFLSRE